MKPKRAQAYSNFRKSQILPEIVCRVCQVPISRREHILDGFHYGHLPGSVSLSNLLGNRCRAQFLSLVHLPIVARLTCDAPDPRRLTLEPS